TSESRSRTRSNASSPRSAPSAHELPPPRRRHRLLPRPRRPRVLHRPGPAPVSEPKVIVLPMGESRQFDAKGGGIRSGAYRKKHYMKHLIPEHRFRYGKNMPEGELYVRSDD